MTMIHKVSEDEIIDELIGYHLNEVPLMNLSFHSANSQSAIMLYYIYLTEYLVQIIHFFNGINNGLLHFFDGIIRLKL